MSENKALIVQLAINDKIESDYLIKSLSNEKENIKNVEINLPKDKETLKFLKILLER